MANNIESEQKPNKQKANKTSKNLATNPVANSKPFGHKQPQPSPEAKKRGWAERNARIRMQKHLEATLEEQLSNPALNKKEIEFMVDTFSSDATMADVIFRVYMRSIVDDKCSPAVKQRLVDSLIKIGYGDKLTVQATVDTGPTLAQAIANKALKLKVDTDKL